ncbi:MupG family TIM beta-alpha barrel fold protein [Marinilactibacillus sp. XAAS-LB27]|uniref:DUF871 domain-containing protein n=1 Tax=Marinilactibacillus sp. XAAS-LB27 TaxID=3114538 RepID=UPI002E19DAFF|nr:MupG family TIM beta-alpha barrel fold protein [Marinilactibacillus sp. XAAS-LB27]
MKRRLGMSLYPDHSDFENDKAYIDLTSQYHFKRIFMSMLEVTEGKEKVAQKFKKTIDYAKNKGFEIVLDIAPNIFQDLNISYDDLSFFNQLGADGIRLDVGFDGNKESIISFNPYALMIELNMSNDVAYLNNILTYEPNKPFLSGCHNFYPQEGTALPYDFFVSCSERFRKEGLRTAAFITSQVGEIGPWDINDGLPTLEMHRHLPVEIQAKHLFATGLVDDIIIGNAYASEAELKALSKIDPYRIEFEIDFGSDTSEDEKAIVLENLHYRRGDITERMVRSTEVRKLYTNENLPHDNEESFVRGDVVIGNALFGKYQNELQIVLEPHSDIRKNKVGKISTDELFLLEYITPWKKFRFVEK